MSRCFAPPPTRDSRPAALSALMQYGDSDSESDSMEVETVDVERLAEKRARSSSPAAENGDGRQPKRTPLPVPAVLQGMFGGSAEQGPRDDPALHQGRVRNFAHVRGNWATYVCIPYEASSAFHSLVASCLAICQNAVALVAHPNFHVSLTRTLVLKHHWINDFVESVRKSAGNHARFRLALGPARAYVNDEGTRTFLGLGVTSGVTAVASLSAGLDHCLAEYGLPPFYKEGSFHLSVAWCNGDRGAALQRLLPQLDTAVGEFGSLADVTLACDVTEVHCHCGNRRFELPLADR